MPRINIENNVNLTLGSRNRPKNNEPKIKSGTNNIPSVRQYVNDLRYKKTLTNATNIDDEVSLEGINVKEYTKINNKLVKNPSYIYINKLNLFLASLFTTLLLIESVLFITFLSLNNTITAFEIIFYLLIILVSLTFFIIAYKRFFNDKFKVELRRYNLKNNLFYTSLIFIVSFIILVCINIFLGMTSNNIIEFVLKMILEFIVILNIILYPIVKYVFYKLNKFAN